MDEANRLSSPAGAGKLYGRWWTRGIAARCLLCTARCADRGLCAACLADLPWRGEPAVPRRPRELDLLLAACDYRYPLDVIVMNAKFHADLAALKLAGEMLCQGVSTHLPRADRVLPVPLYGSRRLLRGFNQALELARPLAARLGLTPDTATLRRLRGGRAQSRLSASARRANLAGAFVARGSLAGETVVLVDDVVTTGATLGAAAAALRRAGARRIVGVALAATP